MSFFKRLRSHAKQLILDANLVPFWVAYRTFFIKAGKLKLRAGSLNTF